MGFANRSFELLKRSSHRYPRRLYLLVNEGFEVTRGYVNSLKSQSRAIKKTQRLLLRKNYPQDAKGLIIFLTPGVDLVNGGVLSVTSLANETNHLKAVHGCEVALCTYPSDPVLLKYSKFKNSNTLYSLSDTLAYFQKLQKLIIHIPEHFIYRFSWFLTATDRERLSKIPNVQINIMIQNIDQLPRAKTIQKLAKYGKLTSTTAHRKYSTQQLRDQLGFPLHKLSVFISPEQYQSRSYSQKEDLMIVSPDPYPKKNEILHSIQTKLPNLKIQIIHNLTYEEYKATISRAKWALTFGEGLDGYFIETIFSGGVSFSVYNSRFFTPQFKDFQTVYPSYPALQDKIAGDILALDNEADFAAYQKRQFDLCRSLYDYKAYVANLEGFYRGQYTFT
jgi:hypothetical protein